MSLMNYLMINWFKISHHSFHFPTGKNMGSCFSRLLNKISFYKYKLCHRLILHQLAIRYVLLVARKVSVRLNQLNGHNEIV